MFEGMAILEDPLFTQPPTYISWNRSGKYIWGHDTLRGVLMADPDGPAYYIGTRDGYTRLYEWKYQISIWDGTNLIPIDPRRMVQ